MKLITSGFEAFRRDWAEQGPVRRDWVRRCQSDVALQRKVQSRLNPNPKKPLAALGPKKVSFFNRIYQPDMKFISWCVALPLLLCWRVHGERGPGETQGGPGRAQEGGPVGGPKVRGVRKAQ